MVAALALGLFVAMIALCTASLAVRRSHPGVGEIGGGIVLLLLAIGVIGGTFSLLGTAVAALGDPGAFSSDFSPGRSLADFASGAGILLGIPAAAAGIGYVQGRVLGMKLASALLGGIGEFFLAALCIGALTIGSGTPRLRHGGTDPMVHIQLALFGAWILAELTAPFVLRFLLKRKSLPRREARSAV